VASIGVIEAEFEDLIGTAMGCGEVIDADLAMAFIALLKGLLRVVTSEHNKHDSHLIAPTLDPHLIQHIPSHSQTSSTARPAPSAERGPLVCRWKTVRGLSCF
jgi:hypothetical protein